MEDSIIMIHITLTGFYAGIPYCGCNKEDRRKAGDSFMHMPYTHFREFMERADICPKCKQVWDDSANEEEMDV